MDIRRFCQTLTSRAKTVEDRQALYRREMTPKRYSGKLHVAFTVTLCTSLAVACGMAISSWGPIEIGAMVAAVLASMSFIYFGHRFPMHRPVAGGVVIYDLHTRCHHMLFDYERTQIRKADDVYMVMMPPWLALLLCLVGFPAVAALVLPVSLDAALAFLGVVYLYFLAYELVHLAAHAPPEHAVHRVPGLGAMLRHHQRHHAWSDMHKGNFSMLFPLWDWVLGTKLPRR